MKNQVALVTGASSGLGEDFAKALLAEGMVVYAAARRMEKMDGLKQLGVIPIQMDITKEQDITEVVNKIEKDHGGVDLLINNAGFGVYGAVEDVSLEDARYQFEVNLFGLARLTQLVLPGMRTKRAGKIINISSMGGRIYTPLGSWYYATKHALEGWSDCLRIELAQFGINVVVIQPGAIETEFIDVMSKPLLKRSDKGPYQKLADRTAAAMADPSKLKASPVSVITKLVIQAVRAKKPKTRYVAGKFAKPLMFVRKWFGDRFFDKLLMSMMK